jgi:hypothetical protein
MGNGPAKCKVSDLVERPRLWRTWIFSVGKQAARGDRLTEKYFGLSTPPAQEKARQN